MRLLPRKKWEWIRLGGLLILGFAAWIYRFGLALLAFSQYQPQQGDIVFQPLPHCKLTNMIEGITHSPYSHCGILFQEQNKWMVLEAIGEVRTTSLYWWIRRGRLARFTAYRLKPPYQQYAQPMMDSAFRYLGRPYDFNYSLDEETIYCSELVYKAFMKVSGQNMGKLISLDQLDWKPYEQTIRELEGGDPPLNREIITPRDLARAQQLERVFAFHLD